MSIARDGSLPIKVLKDLNLLRPLGFYRHAGPNGPEEVFSRGRFHSSACFSTSAYPHSSDAQMLLS